MIARSPVAPAEIAASWPLVIYSRRRRTVLCAREIRLHFDEHAAQGERAQDLDHPCIGLVCHVCLHVPLSHLFAVGRDTLATIC
jgi:hypothetical protein